VVVSEDELYGTLLASVAKHTLLTKLRRILVSVMDASGD
jgi:hypothetical protein